MPNSTESRQQKQLGSLFQSSHNPNRLQSGGKQNWIPFYNEDNLNRSDILRNNHNQMAPVLVLKLTSLCQVTIIGTHRLILFNLTSWTVLMSLLFCWLPAIPLVWDMGLFCRGLATIHFPVLLSYYSNAFFIWMCCLMLVSPFVAVAK